MDIRLLLVYIGVIPPPLFQLIFIWHIFVPDRGKQTIFIVSDRFGRSSPSLHTKMKIQCNMIISTCMQNRNFNGVPLHYNTSNFGVRTWTYPHHYRVWHLFSYMIANSTKYIKILFTNEPPHIVIVISTCVGNKNLNGVPLHQIYIYICCFADVNVTPIILYGTHMILNSTKYIRISFTNERPSSELCSELWYIYI